MVWFELALFAVSFLLTALLAPKPEFENAKAEELDPDNFPKASENAPIPLVFGCTRIKGPNTLWYGDYNAVPITRKQKTGLFSSTRVTVGYEYYLSLQLGLCLGEASIKEIFIDSVPVSSGITSDESENFEFYAESTTGIETEDAATVGDTIWDTDFDTVGDSSPTDLFLLTDLGLDAFGIDNGDYTLDITCDVGGQATIPIFSPSTVTLNFSVEFLDENAIELVADELTGSQAVTVFNGVITTEQFQITGPIPATARRIRINAFTVNGQSVSDVGTVRNQVLRVTGRSLTPTIQFFDINEPELFGGRESGGGWIGNVSYYPGNFTQPIDPDLESSIGAGLVPAYRGLAYLMMPNQYIGERPALQRMEFEVARYTDNLGNGVNGQAFVDSLDADPAEVIYTMCIDGWAGLDIQTSRLNLASFQAASATLVAEQHGVSGTISSSRQGKQVLRELLAQVDGVLAENSAGEVELKLIRDDYVESSLVIYDEDDIIEISRFSQTAWSDVVTEVKVIYSDRESDGDGKIAPAQNDATLDMINTRRTTEVSFPFCYDPALANQLAARELSRLSIPLIKFTAVMNRSAYQLVVGDVIKVSFAEYGLSELVCRVQKVDTGELDDNKVTVELIQDIYAISTTTFAVPVNTGWVDNRPEPVTIPTQEIVEMPYFYSSSLETPIDDGFVGVVPFAAKPQTGSTGYTFNFDTVTGELGFFNPASIDYGYHGQLDTAYSATEGFETGIDTTTGITLTGVTGDQDDTIPAATDADIGAGIAGIMYANGEWMGYEGAVDNGSGSFTLSTIHRGLLGTQAVDHTASTNFWILSVEQLGDGSIGDALAEAATIYWTMLDETGGTRRSNTAETEASQAVTNLANRPLRPRDLQIESSRAVVPFDAGADPTFDVSWVASSRTSGVIPDETDAAETPDITETYDVQIWIDGVDETATYGAEGVASPQSIDLTGAVGTNGEVRVYSRRTLGDLRSSAYYAAYPFDLGVSGSAGPLDADTFLQSIYSDLADSTTSFTDQSIRANPLTTVGDAVVTSGELVLDGTDDSLIVDDGDLDEFSWMLAGDIWTFEAWIIGRPDNGQAASTYPNSLWSTQAISSGSGVRGINMSIQQGGECRVFAFNGNVTNSTGQICAATTTAAVPDDGLPHHVVWEWKFESADTARCAISIDGGAIEIFNETNNLTPTIGPVELQQRLFGITGLAGNTAYGGNVEGIRLTRGQHIYGMFDLGAGMTFTPTPLSSVDQSLNMDQSTPLTPARFLSSNWPELHATDLTRLYLTEALLVEGDSPNIIHAIYARGDAHAGTTDFNIEKLTSTDYGATWPTSSRVVISDTASESDRNHAVIRDPSSGRIIVFYRNGDASDVTQDIAYRYSDDDGATWSAAISVLSELTNTTGGVPWGPGVVTSQGLCMPFYDVDECELLFSTDGGLTWGNAVVAYTGQTNYNEPSIVSDGSGNVALIARLDSGGTRKSFGIFTSTDGGLTWGSITTATFPVGGSPTTANPYRLANCNGTIKGMWCSRDQSDSGVYVTEMSVANFFLSPTEIITGTGNATRTQIATMPRWNTLSAGNNDVGYASPARIHDRDYATWYADLNGGEVAIGLWIETI